MALSLALRTAAHPAFRGALCTLGIAGLTLALPGTAAAHPHHEATSHGSSHKSRHAGHASTHASTHAAKADKHANRRGRHSHHGRRDADAAYEGAGRDIAEQAPSTPALAIPQLALPDLAVSAATFPAGRTLGGFGGPVETAMVPASAASRTLAAITHSAASLLDGLVSRARGQLGTRYVFGGAEPGAGLDCSSFARYAMEALGVRLPRTANQQAQIGRPIPRDAALLRPGDLLTFGSARHVSHVGIYLGQGRFIHASVKHGEVIETTIEHNRSLFRRWQGARRLLASVDDSTPDATGAAGG